VVKVILSAENLPPFPKAHPGSLGVAGGHFVLGICWNWSRSLHNMHPFTCAKMHADSDRAAVQSSSFPSLSLQALWRLFDCVTRACLQPGALEHLSESLQNQSNLSNSWCCYSFQRLVDCPLPGVLQQTQQ